MSPSDADGRLGRQESPAGVDVAALRTYFGEHVEGATGEIGRAHV